MKKLMSLPLKESSLLETRAHLNGAWIEGSSTVYGSDAERIAAARGKR